MRFRLPLLLICLLIALGLAGCISLNNSSDNQRPDLEVSGMVSSIGAVEGRENSFDVQKFSYSLTLTNNDREEVYIKEVHVLLPAEFEKRVTTKNYLISVDKTIAPNSYIEIENSLEFDAKGLTKEDIEEINPHISSLKIIIENTINLEERF